MVENMDKSEKLVLLVFLVILVSACCLLVACRHGYIRGWYANAG